MEISSSFVVYIYITTKSSALQDPFAGNFNKFAAQNLSIVHNK